MIVKPIIITNTDVGKEITQKFQDLLENNE
jgi:hypothetical protein